MKFTSGPSAAVLISTIDNLRNEHAEFAIDLQTLKNDINALVDFNHCLKASNAELQIKVSALSDLSSNHNDKIKSLVDANEKLKASNAELHTQVLAVSDELKTTQIRIDS